MIIQMLHGIRIYYYNITNICILNIYWMIGWKIVLVIVYKVETNRSQLGKFRRFFVSRCINQTDTCKWLSLLATCHNRCGISFWDGSQPKLTNANDSSLKTRTKMFRDLTCFLYYQVFPIISIANYSRHGFIDILAMCLATLKISLYWFCFLLLLSRHGLLTIP